MLRVMEVMQHRSQSMENRVDTILDAVKGIGERVRRVEAAQNPTNAVEVSEKMTLLIRDEGSTPTGIPPQMMD